MNFRELFWLIEDYTGASLYQEVLLPWLEKNMQSLNWLQEFSLRSGNPVPPVTLVELWDLYAFSRVNELLIYNYQPSDSENSNSSFRWFITLDQYIDFMQALGLTPIQHSVFSPFHHEIVSVEQSIDHNAPIIVMKEFWPCLMLGNMMFSRAGVKVCGGAAFIDKNKAEKSKIYWTYLRKNRPFNDLSHGWGANSQWRTSFRRDYIIDGQYHYNVDGEYNAGLINTYDDLGLSVREQIEIVTNRCFILSSEHHWDLFPYDLAWPTVFESVQAPVDRCEWNDAYPADSLISAQPKAAEQTKENEPHNEQEENPDYDQKLIGGLAYLLLALLIILLITCLNIYLNPRQPTYYPSYPLTPESHHGPYLNRYL